MFQARTARVAYFVAGRFTRRVSNRALFAIRSSPSHFLHNSWTMFANDVTAAVPPDVAAACA